MKSPGIYSGLKPCLLECESENKELEFNTNHISLTSRKQLISQHNLVYVFTLLLS